MSASAETTRLSASSRGAGANPVSRLFVMSCARSRSSMTSASTSTSFSLSTLTVSASIRSASMRVEEGLDSPEEITAMRRALISGPLPAESERRAGRGGSVLIRRAGGQVVATVGTRPRLARRSVAVDGLHSGSMRRPVGCSGRTVLRQLPAQHRDDLTAEDVELLEHRLQRQARVVDEEQLTLEVAEGVPHRRVAVDDLLGRAHGERSHLGEVLHARAVAVHGGMVDVRPELAHRVLRVRTQEDLTADADDRLLGRAVSVVREALPVQLDQALIVHLRPEDVVGEEAVTVVRGLLGDLGGADGAVPDERLDAVQRARCGRE